MSDRNEDVRSFIDRYLERHPKYAIMIEGDWGSGKTYLVRNMLSRDDSTLIVSANGVSTQRELIERLYFEAYPALSNKTMKALGSIARTVAGFFRIRSDMKMDDLLEIDRYRTIIIDDIERSRMPIVSLFGFLNNFVEHDDKHLILIGNESEIPEKDDYRRIKEKVVGFSIKVQPDYESLLTNYCNPESSYHKFIIDNISSIISLFEEGHFTNLRVIENSIDDAEVLYNRAISNDIENASILETLSCFVILDYNYRRGKLTREDLQYRELDSFTRALKQNNENYVRNKIDDLQINHPSFDLYTSNFDNDFLVAKICDGKDRVELLDRTFGDLIGRSKPSMNAEWRNLWYYIHQDDEVIHESYERMRKKLENMEYVDAGEIIHVFGLMYVMLEIGVISISKTEIQQICCNYVDKLTKMNLMPEFRDDFLGSLRHGSAHGLGFQSMDEPGFKRIYEYFLNKSKEQKDKNLLLELQDILYSDRFDLEQFKSIILQGDRSDNVYSRTFLHQLDPKQFASACLTQPAGKQFDILYALRSRYYHSPYPDVVKSEAGWLRKVIYALRRSELTDLSRKRLNDTLSMTITKFAK